MPSWGELSAECRDAALLLRGSHPRSSVSRSYYAAYCAITDRLVAAKATFPRGWNNPPHLRLPQYIDGHLSDLPVYVRARLKSTIRLLWRMRVDADYVPQVGVDAILARDALREAMSAIRSLEARHERA